jgi:hypothetical protein
VPPKVKKAIIPTRSKKGWITPLDSAARTPERPTKPKPPVTPEEESTNSALRFTLLIGLGTAVVLFIVAGGVAMMWLGGGSRDRPVNYKAAKSFPDALPPPVPAAAPEPEKVEIAADAAAAGEPPPAPEPVAAAAPLEEPSEPAPAPDQEQVAAAAVPQEEPTEPAPAPEEEQITAAAAPSNEPEPPDAAEEPVPAAIPGPASEAAPVPAGQGAQANGSTSQTEDGRVNAGAELDEIATDAELMIQELCQGSNDPALMSELAREELKAKLEQVIAEEKARVGA